MLDDLRFMLIGGDKVSIMINLLVNRILNESNKRLVRSWTRLAAIEIKLSKWLRWSHQLVGQKAMPRQNPHRLPGFAG